MMYLRKCCGTGNILVKNVLFRDVSIIKQRRPVGLQIRSQLVAVNMASTAAEHRCRRLDGKVAVVTASTAGFV